VEEIREEIQTIQLRLEARKREDAALRNQMAAYQGRIESAPGLESELTELMRDYDTLEQSYLSLLRKSEESKMAVNLERRQIGEQFRTVDGARLPERPISPDRARINLMGLLAGLGFGVAIAAFLEYRDTSFKTDDDVTVSLALPVLAVIPLMLTGVERKRMQRMKLTLALSASVAVVLVAMAALAMWQFDLIDRVL
jgi:hypothetical protein